MARQRLDYLSPLSHDLYQGLLHSSLPVTIREQLYPSLPAANAAIQEGMRLCAISHNAISRVHDCYMERCEDGRYKAVSVLEPLLGGVEGKEWREWELISLLRALVSALSSAERLNIAFETISPRALFLTSEGVKLFPSLGSMDEAYQSPERKQSQYDPFKSDVYSLGMTVLSLALGQAPNLPEAVRTDPSSVLGALGTLGYLLGWMLRRAEDRPSFGQLEGYFLENASYYDSLTEVYSASEVVEEVKVVETLPIEKGEMPVIPHQEPVPLVVPEPSVPKSPRQCPVCFQSFLPTKKHPNSLYCSKKCREHKAIRDPPASDPVPPLVSTKCAYCPVQLNTSEKQELSCGHSFHSLDCLFAFMVAKSDHFSKKVPYHCPTCNQRIKYGKEIEQVFGKSALQRRMEEAQNALLCSQCHSAPFSYERRGQLLCANCSR